MKQEKALQWKFDNKYNGKHVICNYITYKNHDNVHECFNSLEQAETYMNDNDMWEDYYIYEIIGGYAYPPIF